MKLKETLQKALDNLPRIAAVALLTLVLSACDTSPTSNPNTGSSGGTELNSMNPDALNQYLAVPTPSGSSNSLFGN